MKAIIEDRKEMKGLTQKALARMMGAKPAMVSALLNGERRLNEDWINSECLRERIKNDPIGAVLESKYPIPGRTKEERQIVVSQYRSVLGFLSLIEKWKNGLEIDIRDFVSNSFELPVFAFFHILSAPETRKSAVLIVGDFQRENG